MSKKQRPVSDTEVAEWRRLRKQGRSLAEIAKRAGRDRSTIQRHVSDLPHRETRRREAYDSATIAEARELRRQGWSYDSISDKLGPSLGVLNKWLKDVPRPPTQKQTKVSMRKLDQKERAQKARDMAAPMFKEREEPTKPRYSPVKLPDSAEGFSLEGIFPDPQIVAWADQVSQRFLTDKAKGVIFDGVPIEAVKAHIIMATTMRPWDDAWLRTNRDQWDPIRLFCSLNVETLAERIGISGSSFTRYANGTRTPNTGDLERIGVALWAAMQDRLYNLDLHLVLHDYAAAHNLGSEDPYDLDEAMRWIAGVDRDEEGFDEEVTLRHLPSLTHVRSLMPAPLYRDEDTILFGYAGYAVTDDQPLEEEDEDETDAA